MKTYIVTYDLHRPGQNYDALFEAIKACGSWYHYQQSAWIVVTHLSAVQVRDKLMKHIDSNDSLVVARLAGEAAWWGLEDVGSKWLKQQLELVA